MPQSTISDLPPLPGQRRVHAGCGFISGLVVGALSAVFSPPFTWPRIVLRVLAVAVVSAGLAYWLGQRFWKGVFIRWPRGMR